MSDNMNKEKVVSIRMTEAEYKQLNELVQEQANGNRTTFIIQKCLQSEGNIENISTILEFIIYLKEQLVCLKNGSVKKKKFISDMNERIKTIWQSLK